MARKIGNRIKELRIKKGFTQSQLADELGFTSQTISNWESGAREPDIDALVHLAFLFDVTLDYLLLGKLDEPFKSFKCPVCGGDRFVKPHYLHDNYYETKNTCIHCGYTLTINHDVKVSYFRKLRELNHILSELSSKQSRLKLYESKIEDMSKFKNDLRELKKKQALLIKTGAEENSMMRALEDSILELEEIIKTGKDRNAIHEVNSLTIEIKNLLDCRNEILGRLRDPFKKDVDIIKEASDRNLESLEKEIVQELLSAEVDRYIEHATPLGFAGANNKPQFVMLDDSLLNSYDKFNCLLNTLRQKINAIQLVKDETKADYILVETKDRKNQLGEKGITIKEFGTIWNLNFNSIFKE